MGTGPGPLEQPDTADGIKAMKSWQDSGYEVLGICPECQWGFIVGSKNGEEFLRHFCTAYGECELAPG